MKWSHENKEKFRKEFMQAVAFWYKGKLNLKKCQINLNSFYYQKTILERIFEKQIPALYGKDINKVEHDIDKTSIHTSKSTIAYSSKYESQVGIKYATFNEIPAKRFDSFPWAFVHLIF